MICKVIGCGPPETPNICSRCRRQMYEMPNLTTRQKLSRWRAKDIFRKLYFFIVFIINVKFNRHQKIVVLLQNYDLVSCSNSYGSSTVDVV